MQHNAPERAGEGCTRWWRPSAPRAPAGAGRSLLRKPTARALVSKDPLPSHRPWQLTVSPGFNYQRRELLVQGLLPTAPLSEGFQLPPPAYDSTEVKRGCTKAAVPRGQGGAAEPAVLLWAVPGHGNAPWLFWPNTALFRLRWQRSAHRSRANTCFKLK